MTFCVDIDLTKTQILRTLSIDYSHEHNYFLHEISFFLRAHDIAEGPDCLVSKDPNASNENQ